ncbi:putative prepilin peptidase [Candidatus Nitrosocaldus cavascurensis]|uniref:Putative prepilin peptidase n=2 Tax=Candidatus Nitrosocaldaceae TaxID=1968910 RepID=A0A2K5AS99_9ARCH|nr:putative prepilin peptidase [Candidatus Nitrosocaldus cavascurensis]
MYPLLILYMITRGTNGVIILTVVAVTIVSMYIVLQQITTQATVASMIVRYEVLDASLLRINESQAYFSVVLKNSGNKEFVYTEVGFYDDNGVYHRLHEYGVVHGGEKFSKEGIFDARITYGQEYVMKVTARDNDGSTYNISKMVKAK